ncbi:MAG: 4-hydroxy-3-methylbut-2-enyl diphosphate reductase [Lachnospiraceae bacterium]|nr:4-hydroxy-3-methylbut-2-enyl diphosphate reductase [Lachnospiraceae bacterium]
MEVTVAKTAGFCFGVERAVRMVREEADRGTFPLYTYGPIIHNETVVEDLARRGVRILNEERLREIEAAHAGSGLPQGTVILRSHGVSRSEEERMRRAGLRVLDATCPFVKKIHRIAEETGKEGRRLIICGDKNHPEVRGIVGWSTGPADVLGSADELGPQAGAGPATVVAQTTLQQKNFQEMVEKLRTAIYDIRVVNTICNATQMRQSEAAELSLRSDTILVIGGADSSNSRKLYEICRNRCGRTYFIRTLEDLVKQGIRPTGSVGITAGASTPKNIIEEVQTYVRSEF